MILIHDPPPFTFEDRTADLCNTDLEDIFDRRFFHVQQIPDSNTTQIFEMHFPASRHRGHIPNDREPIVRLEFRPNEYLGKISFMQPLMGNFSTEMSQYLPKTSFFGSPLSRKFKASDGREYRWEYTGNLNPLQEWTCTTTDNNEVVAHYDLAPSDIMPQFKASGNILVIYDSYANTIAPEIVATCFIMRHILSRIGFEIRQTIPILSYIRVIESSRCSKYARVCVYYLPTWLSEMNQQTGPYVQSGEPLNEFLKAFWQRQVDAAEQETPDYRHPPLPLARIKKVMKSDPDIKMIAADAPILFCKACEIFISEVTARAFIIADSNKRRTLSRADIAKALSKSDQFDFLIDIVPREEGALKKGRKGGVDVVYKYISTKRCHANGNLLKLFSFEILMFSDPPQPARLSISPPFPSPSSSFLTPPTPGAHEFALKLPRKRSTASTMATPTNPLVPLPPSPSPAISTTPTAPTIPSDQIPPPRLRTNLSNRSSRPLSTASATSTASSASAFDPNLFSSRPAPPSPGALSNSSLSRMSSLHSKSGSKPVSRANSLRNHRLSSHALSANSSSPVSTLSGRADGPQSHRLSSASQLSRSFSSSSLLSVTTTTSPQMGISFSSPAIQSTSISSTISPTTTTTSSSTSTASVSTSDALLPATSSADEPKVFVKIRDFAFQPNDERHQGEGPLVPKPNRVGSMNRKLGGRSYSSSSISSSEGGSMDEEDGEPWGWDSGTFGSKTFGYGGGWGRFTWAMGSGAGAATAATIFDQEKAYAAAAANLSAAASKTNSNGNAIKDDQGTYPSRSDMDRNFLDSESEEFYDAEDDNEEEEEDEDRTYEEDEEPLYPGLYRAMYAFEPEGTAEMRLVEDQIVKVIGRGGGVGWAVVVVAEPPEQEIIKEAAVVENDSKPVKHALVPESYLEPYKLDWELGESDEATNSRTG